MLHTPRASRISNSRPSNFGTQRLSIIAEVNPQCFSRRDTGRHQDVLHHLNQAEEQLEDERDKQQRLAHEKKLEELEEQAAAVLKRFLTKKQGSVLRAWLTFFDPDGDEVVTWPDFVQGIHALTSNNGTANRAMSAEDQDFVAHAKKLFNNLDRDRSEFLRLEEVDQASALLWSSFKSWAGTKFSGMADMLSSLKAASTDEDVKEVTKSVFVEGCAKLGWTGGSEDVLFSAMVGEKQILEREDVCWLDTVRSRLRAKALSKMIAVRREARYSRMKQEAVERLEQFKTFLRTKCGGYVHAWRTRLCPSSDANCMTIRKMQFHKVCVELGFCRNVNQIWSELDRDDAGFVSFSELHFRSAEALARLQILFEKCGGVANAFRRADSNGSGRLYANEFELFLVRHGIDENKAKCVFRGLVPVHRLDGRESLVENDLKFLDRWKPAPWIVAKPNFEAKAALKMRLLRKYNSYLRAWRLVLDWDGSNRCDWNEFCEGCRILNFVNDVAGAFRAFDADMSGFITLKELDPSASDQLLAFKEWADNEFGSVRSLFNVFDKNGSGSLSHREFKHHCIVHGFAGNSKELYMALDGPKRRTGVSGITLKDMDFLDNWIKVTDEECPKCPEVMHKCTTISPELQRSVERLTQSRRNVQEERRAAEIDTKEKIDRIPLLPYMSPRDVKHALEGSSPAAPLLPSLDQLLNAPGPSVCYGDFMQARRKRGFPRKGSRFVCSPKQPAQETDEVGASDSDC